MNERLRELRLSKNIICEEMAKILGLSKATYSKKENGLVKFSLSEAKIIADIFNLKIEDIFFNDEVSK